MTDDKQIVFSLIGDKSVGKSCLLNSYAKDEFHWDYTPTSCDHYGATTTIEHSDFSLEFYDTGGDEDDDEIKKFCISKSHAFIVAFNMLGIL